MCDGLQLKLKYFFPCRWTSDICIRGLVQTGSEAVKVRLVWQREAAEVSHPGRHRCRPLALLRHKRPQLPLRATQRHHVRFHIMEPAADFSLLGFKFSSSPFYRPLNQHSFFFISQPHPMGRASGYKPNGVLVSQCNTVAPQPVSDSTGDVTELHNPQPLQPCCRRVVRCCPLA